MLKNKKILFSISCAAVLIAIVVLAWPAKKSTSSAGNLSVGASQPETPQIKNTTSFDKSQYSINQASSLWVVVNKGRSLPSDYTPANLTVPAVPLLRSSSNSEMHIRADAAAAMEKMFTAAKASGLNLMLTSGYRSYSEQVNLYANYVKQFGAAQADTFSARAGHSEHQTGLAADIEPTSHNCELDQCFGDTPEGIWLAANADKFGFVIRYQKSTQNLTGYEYEPWHIRYVGTALAQQLQSSDQTLEQFFSLPYFLKYPVSNYEIKNQ